MDVRTLLAEAQDLQAQDCDAIVLVLPSQREACAAQGGWLALLDDALAQGDLLLKPGRVLYLHRPAGFRSARLILAVAGDGAALTARQMDR
ncbi:MAG TPA: leucyl aminopeptidase, partial [Burkholderiaceae bacterium]|nr:leucyl aminopeptidase [Burkholderiaceae bacterium]